jgi:hypothetical protein
MSTSSSTNRVSSGSCFTLVGVAVRVRVGVDVELIGVFVCEGVTVGVSDEVAEAVGVKELVADGVEVAEGRISVLVAVSVGVSVGVHVAVALNTERLLPDGNLRSLGYVGFSLARGRVAWGMRTRQARRKAVSHIVSDRAFPFAITTFMFRSRQS